jgi:triosephosphate isomerase
MGFFCGAPDSLGFGCLVPVKLTGVGNIWDMRKQIIAGNWKMNHSPSRAEALVRDLIPLILGLDCEILVAPASPCLDRVSQCLAGQSIGLAAQHLHWEPEGAYTGETAISMVKELGVTHVIIGHSERRQFFGETNETVNKRVRAVLEAGLRPILCIGETLSERESGATHGVVEAQVTRALQDIGRGGIEEIIFAYEPVWAIGTGKVATTDQAQEVHAGIRNLIGDLYDTAVADQVRIQYGGSVKPDNAQDLLDQPDIDGALVGGASLNTDDFVAICRAAGS